MVYKIAIPSYKRSLICNDKTLKMLNSLGVSKEFINVFVVEEELEEYKKALNPDFYNEIVVGVKGLVQQREFIEKNYEVGTHVIMIDDDITELDLSLTEYKSVDDFFCDAFNECIKQGSYIWGIYPVYNLFFRKKRPTLTTELNYIIGCFYGIIIRKIPELKIELTRDGNKEDVERSILYWLKDGKVLRFNKIAPKTTYYGKDGGGLGKLKDRIDTMMKEAIKINDKYPDITRIKIRKNGLYEIVFSRAKNIKKVDNLKSIDAPVSLPPLNPSTILLEEIHAYLESIDVPLNTGKTGRAGTFGNYRSMTLGYITARISRKYDLSRMTKKFPELYDALNKFGKSFVPFDFDTIQINHNVISPRHLDGKNVGNSVIFSIGDYKGCDLEVEGFGVYNTLYKPVIFNGSTNYHWNTPLESGNKYSFIFFNNQKG